MGAGAAPVPGRPSLILRQIPSDAISYLTMTPCHLRFHCVFTPSEAASAVLGPPSFVSPVLNHRAKMPDQSLMSTVQISGRYHRYPDCS
ncbi:hypothetical protein GCM10010478_36290 [Streptomyces erythrogriseus]|uniref:Uncharacterized protein n=2 Tax=Streptomyces TaxID=1883 RepID=A0ABN3X0V9_9ACTN